jgi:hypothetical protein
VLLLALLVVLEPARILVVDFQRSGGLLCILVVAVVEQLRFLCRSAGDAFHGKRVIVEQMALGAAHRRLLFGSRHGLCLSSGEAQLWLARGTKFWEAAAAKISRGSDPDVDRGWRPDAAPVTLRDSERPERAGAKQQMPTP